MKKYMQLTSGQRYQNYGLKQMGLEKFRLPKRLVWAGRRFHKS